MAKGQITVFIIIGLVIFSSILFFYYYSRASTSELSQVQTVEEDFMPINKFIESCLWITADEGIRFISSQGGYYKPEVETLQLDRFQVPFYYLINHSAVPDRYEIEKELEEYISDKFPLCINNFSEFSEQGFKFKQGELEVNASINEHDLTSEIIFPVEITKGSKKIKMEKFSQKIDIDFLSKYYLVNEIIHEQEKTQDYVPIGFMTDLAYENNFIYTLFNFKDPVMVVNIHFNDGGKEFNYSFAMKYNWSET